MRPLKVLALIRDNPGPDQWGGHVADVVVFPDGATVLHWRTAVAGTEHFLSEADMRSIRELSGRSRLEIIWEERS